MIKWIKNRNDAGFFNLLSIACWVFVACNSLLSPAIIFLCGMNTCTAFNWLVEKKS